MIVKQTKNTKIKGIGEMIVESSWRAQIRNVN